MVSELSEAFTNYLLKSGSDGAIEPLVEALGNAKLFMERDLLNHYAQHGAGELIVTETSSVFIGRRAWVGPNLPATAAAGELWYDTVEAMPMILIAREPHAWSVPEEDYPPLFGWLGCHPVAGWQFQGYLAATGKTGSIEMDKEPAVGLTFNEAEGYTDWFGKLLSENLTWEAASYHLPESVIEEMWEGISQEWSRLRSDVSNKIALVVPKEAYSSDPDDNLMAVRNNPDSPQYRRFALPPDTRDLSLGLRPTIPVQTGFVATRPW